MGFLSKSATYAGVAARFVLSIIVPFALGVALNWVFAFVFLLKWLSNASLDNSLAALVLIGVFAVVFPFVYFWLARGFAFRQGVAKLYDIAHGLVENVVSKVVRTTVIGVQTVGLEAFFDPEKGKLKDRKSFIHQIEEKLPPAVRSILSFLLDQIPIYASLVEIRQTTPLKKENLPQIQPVVQQKVDEFVKAKLLGDSTMWFWALVGGNGVLMVLTWIFFQ